MCINRQSFLPHIKSTLPNPIFCSDPCAHTKIRKYEIRECENGMVERCEWVGAVWACWRRMCRCPFEIQYHVHIFLARHGGMEKKAACLCGSRVGVVRVCSGDLNISALSALFETQKIKVKLRFPPTRTPLCLLPCCSSRHSSSITAPKGVFVFLSFSFLSFFLVVLWIHRHLSRTTYSSPFFFNSSHHSRQGSHKTKHNSHSGSTNTFIQNTREKKSNHKERHARPHLFLSKENSKNNAHLHLPHPCTRPHWPAVPVYHPSPCSR